MLFCNDFHRRSPPFNGNYPDLTKADFLDISDRVLTHDTDIRNIIQYPFKNSRFTIVANGVLSEKGTHYQGRQLTQQSMAWAVHAG